MASKQLWKIIDHLKTSKTVTPRQVQSLLGCDCKKSNRLLAYLLAQRVVANIGKPHYPEYRLCSNGENKIQPLKAEKPAVKTHSTADACRQNWQGYQIHKIWGSARS